MARASLIFRYQWRAFWRRVLRTGRVKFYLTVLALLGWMTAVALPDSLSRAAGELAAGQTASMDRLLLVVSLLWLVVLGEDLHVSLSSDRLRRFPLDVRSLLALRLFSIFLSPIAWLATILSLLGLSPLLSAPHPLLGSLAAVFFLALTIGIGLSVSQPAGIARWRRRQRRRGGARRRGGGIRTGFNAAWCPAAERESHGGEPGDPGHDCRGRDHTVCDGHSSGSVTRQRCRCLVSTSLERPPEPP